MVILDVHLTNYTITLFFILFFIFCYFLGVYYKSSSKFLIFDNLININHLKKKITNSQNPDRLVFCSYCHKFS